MLNARWHWSGLSHPHVYVGTQFTLAILVMLVPDSYADAALTPAGASRGSSS
jgi:hypothetical protein